MSDPMVVRNVNGHDKVFCHLHDPENGFAEWLKACDDALEYEDRTLE
ncbi:MAG TPA: hypothetical protein VFG51_01230 [Candidatus Saccharimonadia bacterium]|nr:hypothetical protein [Candidatus Saccharimonadia bacterium]